MFRTILPSLRSTLQSLPKTSSAFVPLRPTSIQILNVPAKWRQYSAAAGLSKEDISERVLDVMKSFEKVDGGKLTPNAAFTSDLGLDSLDAVEVVMAIEEEFGIEIPDAEADEITTVGQAIEYIAKTPEAH